MDRVPYRRVLPSRNSAMYADRHDHSGVFDYDTGHQEETISRGETLILQCIICSVMMVIVLLVGITDIAPAVAVRNSINQVLTGAETLDELMTEVRQFGADWLGWEPVESPNAYDVQETVYFPIDEYEDEYNYDYPAADEQVSNHTVPEPLVTPGLWD